MPDAPAVDAAPLTPSAVSRRRRRRGWTWTIVTVAVLAVYLFPVYWMISASLQPQANSADTAWFPASPGLGGYQKAPDGAGVGGPRGWNPGSVGAGRVDLALAGLVAYAASMCPSSD